MATTPMSRVVGHLRKVALLQEAERLTDAQLLESFLLQGEEASFEALVRRHGPMILGVCRRVLHNRHDSEDAFQATFLVLLRKAASIGKRELLVNWLYGVAYRTALKARNATARRRVKERQVPDMAQKQATRDDAIQDLLPLLDQELSRLPDKYRVPIILCDLEGKTRKKAAEQLGLAESTLSMRLDRARAMLAKRLARHGTVFSGAAVALTISQSMASASVPRSLVLSTVKIGATVVAGKSGTAAAISAKVAALTERVVKTMLLTKLKTMVGVLVVVVVLGSGLAALGTVALAENQVKSQKQQEHKREKPVLAAQNNDGSEKDAQEPPKDFTNSVGMKFVWIPPGTFMMGSPQEEQGRMGDELEHRVTLTKGFYLGAYLVTQEQWVRVMGENPSEFGGEKDLPVDSVSWDDCQAFIIKLRERDKNLYRLPSEAEWEYACRSGTKTPFFFGKTISTNQANFDGNSIYGNGKKGLFRERTTPAGAFPANAWGLYDMHGNLWQWCEDRRWFYSGKDVVDPQGPEPRKYWAPDRMLRGGSWDDIPGRCRSACRFSNPPVSRGAVFGFRVAMTYVVDEPKQGTPPAKDEKHEAQEGVKKKMTTTKQSFGLEKVDLGKATIRGGIVHTNPERTVFSAIGSDWEISVLPTIKIMIDGKPSQLAGLQTLRKVIAEETIINVEWEYDLSEKAKKGLRKGKAISIEAVGTRVNGLLQRINISKDSIVVNTFGSTLFSPRQPGEDVTEDSKSTDFKLAPDIAVRIDDKPAKLSGLKRNMLVWLQMSAAEDLVLGITAFGPTVVGLTKTVDANANTISVRIPLVHVTADSLSVAKDAKVVIDGTAAKLSDLIAGMRVTLQMSAEPEQSLVIGIMAGKAPER